MADALTQSRIGALEAEVRRLRAEIDAIKKVVSVPAAVGACDHPAWNGPFNNAAGQYRVCAYCGRQEPC